MDIEETEDEWQCRMESQAEDRLLDEERAHEEAVDRALGLAEFSPPDSPLSLLAAEVVKLRARLQTLRERVPSTGEAPF